MRSQTTLTIFGFFWPPTPSVYIFYDINVYKKSIFLTTNLPLLVNVVCERPLSIAEDWERWETLTFRGSFNNYVDDKMRRVGEEYHLKRTHSYWMTLHISYQNLKITLVVLPCWSLIHAWGFWLNLAFLASKPHSKRLIQCIP